MHHGVAEGRSDIRHPRQDGDSPEKTDRVAMHVAAEDRPDAAGRGDHRLEIRGVYPAGGRNVRADDRFQSAGGGVFDAVFEPLELHRVESVDLPGTISALWIG